MVSMLPFVRRRNQAELKNHNLNLYGLLPKNIKKQFGNISGLVVFPVFRFSNVFRPIFSKNFSKKIAKANEYYTTISLVDQSFHFRPPFVQMLFYRKRNLSNFDY